MDDGRTEPVQGQSDAGGASWLDREHSAAMRALVERYLNGDRKIAADVQELSSSLCACARANSQSAERLLIGIRALWRELGLTHGDRLQVAALYDQLVRRSIERFYERSD